MPYFNWKGVNILGDFKKGKLFARSEKELDSLLFERNLALISCYENKLLISFARVSLDDKILFFRQLSVLLDSGVRLAKALKVLAEQISNIKLKKIIFDIETDIQEGFSFSMAMEKHPDIFDELMIRMSQVGQESGNLSKSLTQLCDYLDTTNSFYKKLKSVSVLPLITLVFFIFITLLIFLFVIPKFGDVFKSMNKELPPVTKFILKVSNFLHGNLFVVSTIFILLSLLFLIRYFKKRKFSNIFDRMYIGIPLIGRLAKNSFLVYFLQSVSILLEGGVRLVPAICVVKSSVKTDLFKNSLITLEEKISAGSSLSQAMEECSQDLFPSGLTAMVMVGQESGRLWYTLKKAAEMYQDRVNKSILFFTTAFQPILMIVLGLLITFLIFAIYIPVFSLADVV